VGLLTLVKNIQTSGQFFEPLYMPEQNGLAERMNQTLSTLANTMLEESKLPKSFWANAMATAAYVTAWSPASGIDGKIPYQVFFNRQVDPLSSDLLDAQHTPTCQRNNVEESSDHMERSAS
jgi:hypothetical protein